MARPKIVTTFGVLNLLFALFGGCGQVLAIPILRLEAGSHPENRAYDPLVARPVLLACLKVVIVGSLLLAAVLAASGVGLLLMKPWGRRLALVYGWLSVALAVAGIVLNATAYFPALFDQAWMMPDEPGRAGLVVVALGGFIGGSLCGLGYPVALLIGATRRSFVAAFSPPADGDPPRVPASN
jgi:hypothetical protein